MIIDFHAHLERNPITKEYLLTELIDDMKDNCIDRRVISTLDGPSIQEANNTIINLVKQHPNLFYGCAVINPKMDDAIDEVERVSGFEEIKMIEFNSLEHGYRPEKLWYNINPILEICDKKGLLVKVFTGQGPWTMPEEWMYYTRRFPNVKFIFLHLGGSDYAYGTVDICKEEDSSNIMLETSYETEIPSLKRAFSELSPDKFLYGSNYPHNFTKLSIMKFNCLDLSDELKEKMFYKNAIKLLEK